MEQLILHEATRTELERFATAPTHAVLLTGPAGMGKTAIAVTMAERVLGSESSRHPYFLTITPDKGSISIDAVRRLQKFLQLKTTGQGNIRRVVLIEHSQALTTEAQNAFLKLLEEPPADTVVILTAHSPRGLLPTILSRTQTIAIHAPSEAQLQPLIQGSQKDTAAQKQAWFLSGGLPGLLHALLYEEEHPLVASVAQAKEILKQQPFERLAMVDGLSKQKEVTIGVVEALERIARAGLSGAAAKQSTPHIRQWHQVRKASLEAKKALQQSANPKLVLTNLFLSIY